MIISALEHFKDALRALGTAVTHQIPQLVALSVSRTVSALVQGTGVFTAISTFVNVPLKELLILQPA